MKGSAGPVTPCRVSRRALRALKPRGLSSAAPFLRTCLKPHALCVSKLSTGSSRAGLAWVQPHFLRVWQSTGHHRRCCGDNRRRALRAALLHSTVLQCNEPNCMSLKRKSRISRETRFWNICIVLLVCLIIKDKIMVRPRIHVLTMKF